MALVLVASLAQATTYYVSTTGSNANDGLTESTPKRNINVCASLMVAGDTCYVRGGTYTGEGTIRLGVTGTAAAPIKLLNYPGELPVISYSSQVTTNRILVEPSVAQPPTALGYITIEGFEITGGWEGIKFINMHNSVIRRNTIHDGQGSGIFSGGGHHNLIERNIIYHQGNFAGCAAGTQSCNQQHGMYLQGDSYTILNNIIYDNLGGGIQQNGSGSSSFTTTRHPDASFAGAANWIIDHNTIAYQRYASGVIIWGSATTNTRVENNILYENKQDVTGGNGGQAVFFTGSGAAGITIKNNLAYATAPGTTSFIGTSGGAVEGVGYTQTNNTVNTTTPGFTSAGGTISGTPDFTLTAGAGAIGLALANEFAHNATMTVGAFDAVGTPTASITTNVLTVTEPISSSVPVANLSTAGVNVYCTDNPTACPGSPTVLSTTSTTGTDGLVDVVIDGITSDACETGQDWKISYDSSIGTWTDTAYIGAYPGLHQPIFSFTDLLATNACTGGGPSSYPGTPWIHYKFNDGTGSSANDETANNLDGTLTGSGIGWGTGITGTGVSLTTSATQYVAIPYGSGVDPSTQSLTMAFGVNIPVGATGLTRYYLGAPLGSSQRLYISARSGQWRLGIQGSADSAASSDLAVTEGWNHLCLTMNSGTDTATLHKNGVAGTANGAVKTYTSYTPVGDLDLGRASGVAVTTNEGVFDEFILYKSVESCSSIYAAFQSSGTSIGGTFGQPAYRFQRMHLESSSPVNLGTAVSTPYSVVENGAIALVVQVHCENVSDCDPTAFELRYKKDGTGSYTPVPDAVTADGISFYGASTEANLNTGTTTSRLTGSCTVTDGATQLTAEQIPTVDLPQDGCVMLRYLLQVGAVSGHYFDLQVHAQGGVALTGTVVDARLNVIDSQCSAP